MLWTQSNGVNFEEEKKNDGVFNGLGKMSNRGRVFWLS